MAGSGNWNPLTGDPPYPPRIGDIAEHALNGASAWRRATAFAGQEHVGATEIRPSLDIAVFCDQHPVPRPLPGSEIDTVNALEAVQQLRVVRGENQNRTMGIGTRRFEQIHYRLDEFLVQTVLKLVHDHDSTAHQRVQRGADNTCASGGTDR